MTADEIEEIGLIAIIRTDAESDLVAAARALADGGIEAVEVTLNTPGALGGIAAIREALGARVRVGAGTILRLADVEAAHRAGAEFIVTPTLQPATIAYTRQHGLPIACGCLTPTEALAAYDAGADFVKLFPADTLGPAYIRALRGPMPFLRLIPTGGVALDNLAAYFEAGCAAVALGSNLVSKERLRNRDWAGLTQAARDHVERLALVRGRGE